MNSAAVNRSALAGLWIAAGFLTRVPVGDPSRGGTKPVHIAGAVPWFPVVGLLIGGVQGLAFWVLSELTESIVAAALSVALAALITGAFHHDGLADIADAFGGGWTVEQRMEILKDSRLGTYGTTALTLALVTEVAAISSLDPEFGARAIVAAHVVGRGVAVAVMMVAPGLSDGPQREGLGASYMADLGRVSCSVAIVCAVMVGFVALADAALVAVPLAALSGAAVVRLAVKKIGGVTGDVLGAVYVMSALAVLVAATF